VDPYYYRSYYSIHVSQTFIICLVALGHSLKKQVSNFASVVTNIFVDVVIPLQRSFPLVCPSNEIEESLAGGYVSGS